MKKTTPSKVVIVPKPPVPASGTVQTQADTTVMSSSSVPPATTSDKESDKETEKTIQPENTENK